MWQREILAARSVGVTRCTQVRCGEIELWHVLSALALKPLHDRLDELTREEASHQLEALLWKDLHAHSEIMPRARARELAQAFVNDYSGERVKFFSNAKWSSFHDRPNGFAWAGFTDASIDGGVIAIDGDTAACVWIQEED